MSKNDGDEKRIKKIVDLYADVIPAEKVERNPAHALKLKEEGNVFLASNNYEKALAKYVEALKYDPQNPVYHFNSGLASGALGQREKAIASYETALSFNPKYYKAHFQLRYF